MTLRNVGKMRRFGISFQSHRQASRNKNVLCCGVCVCVRLREEQRLRAEEGSVLREVCASEGGSNKEAGENCVVRSCILCIVRQVLLRSPGRGWLADRGT
jgi:hypothetical protein